MDQVNQKIDELTKHFEQIPILKSLSQKTGVPLGQIILGVMVILFLLVLIGVGTNSIIHLIGILYPAYMSFKAIETKEEEDDTLWLTYWVVFAAYNFADRFIDYLFFWVPFYFVIKLLVLVYMFFPQTRGAEKVYKIFIGPFFRQYQSSIDEALGFISEEAKFVQSKAAEKAPHIISELSKKEE
jgi:Protein involved in membrane traffic